MNKQNNFCCDIFKKYYDQLFSWMVYLDENNNKINVMPHVNIYNENDERIQLRINNCPSCGVEIRSIEINENNIK